MLWPKLLHEMHNSYMHVATNPDWMGKSYIRVVFSLAATENDDILRKVVNIFAHVCF